MRKKTYAKLSGVCLAGLCAMAVVAFGAGGTASAASLLFEPHNGNFPYHLVGTGGESKLLTVGGKEIKAKETDVLVLVKDLTLFNANIEFLEVEEGAGGFGSSCRNDNKANAVLVSLLGHLGFADPGKKPAALLLVPSGFEFECLGGFAKIKVAGSVIGEIASPGLNTASELERIVFKQTSGKQELQTFLLGGKTLTGQHEESSLNGGKFEESAQAGEADLKALPGQGTFLLKED